MDVEQQEVSSYWLKETGGYSFYVGGRFNKTQYQRTGFFKMDAFQTNPFEKECRLFLTVGALKLGEALR